MSHRTMNISSEKSSSPKGYDVLKYCERIIGEKLEATDRY